MNRREPFDAVSISEKRLILATDLDGTFLGGTDAQRADFYTWIEAHRDGIGLIFVTGRDPGFIGDLTRNQGVPKPDYVVADVGTTIAHMDQDHVVTPITALEDPIAQAWGDAAAKVHLVLSGAPGLRLQPTPFRYRLSYDMDPALFDPSATKAVADLGLDTILSDNRFFDVLPKGVSKGPSLLRLLDHLRVQRHRVLVAGDTMNDLSMLGLGLPAVAVGGSEASLIAEVRDLDHVHKAKAVGAAGIAEAIQHHNLWPKN